MPSAPLSMHLLIPDAARQPLQDGATPAPTRVPVLDALLARLRPAGSIEIGADSPSTPFELALARANHLPGAPGQQPWAAFESAIAGTPCAWLRPCHWQPGLDYVTLVDPAELALTEAESRALLDSLQPLLAEDGLTLRYLRPDVWLAQGELLRGLTTWSIERALQRPLTRDQLALAPNPAQADHLRRLQTELQMLLYHHPVNEARERERRWPINALWINGAGVLDAPLPPDPHVWVEPRLAQLPAPADAGALEAVWRAIDGDSLTQLRRVLEGGGDARLTLCGPRRALSFAPARGLGARISSLFRRQRWTDLRNQL